MRVFVLFLFLFYFFCPPVKADAGTKLVSVLGQDRQKVLLFPFLSFNFSTQRPERRKERAYIYIYIYIFKVSLYAAHCSESLLLFSYCIYRVWCQYEDVIMRHICVYL